MGPPLRPPPPAVPSLTRLPGPPPRVLQVLDIWQPHPTHPVGPAWSCGLAVEGLVVALEGSPQPRLHLAHPGPNVALTLPTIQGLLGSLGGICTGSCSCCGHLGRKEHPVPRVTQPARLWSLTFAQGCGQGGDGGRMLPLGEGVRLGSPGPYSLAKPGKASGLLWGPFL